MYMAHTNAWGSKFDLGGKKVKRQHRTIILAILVALLSPIICAKIRAQGLFGYGEEDLYFFFFTIIWAWQPFWSMDHAHFSNLSFSCPRRLCMKFEQHWPGGFRGKVIWNYQHFFHTNVWGPYKCIQKQTWPRRKKVKCQCMTIILATLVDHPFPMIYANIQPHAILDFGE